MKRRYLPAFAVCLWIVLGTAAGCGTGGGIDRRYRAERALWRIQHEVQQLSIEPQLVSPAQWRNLAARFENIAAENASVAPGDRSAVATQIRTVSARALISAAQIYAGLGDSVRTMSTYERIRSDYDDLPQASAEVALAQGRIAEARRNWAEAAAAYQSVVKKIEPQPGRTGTAGMVLNLPLRAARLRVRAGGDTTLAVRTPLYADAQSYYRAHMASSPGSPTALESRIHLAELYNDLGRWKEAVQELSRAEKDLLAMKPRPRDPAEVRYTIGMILAQRESESGASRETFESLLKDYPESGSAPRALLALSALAERDGDVESALKDLDRIRDGYPMDEELVAQAMLNEGRILERNGRWEEALQVYRTLPSAHPVSEAALLAPLEVVAHYTRVKDTTAVARELTRAEEWYREFLKRYPPGTVTVSAREKLVQTLALQSRYGDVVKELVGLGKSLGQSSQGAQFLLQAAKVCIAQLADTVGTAEILEYTGQQFSDAEVGHWALSEAKRLRSELR